MSPQKISPRLMKQLHLQEYPQLQIVSREPVWLAQSIVGHSRGAFATLDDRFLQHCMEVNPEQDGCSCCEDEMGQTCYFGGEVAADKFAVRREEDLKLRFLNLTAQKFGLPQPTEQAVDDLSEVVRSELDWMVLFPDAVEFLLSNQQVRQRKLNVISNMWYFTARIFQTNTVNNIPLSAYFDHVVTSFMVKARKPKPDIFLKAVELSKVPIEHHLMVGDSVQNDALASLNAGYPYAAIVDRIGELSEERIRSLPDQVVVVNSLMDLDKILPSGHFSNTPDLFS
jgi:FMN phosphatase YigB (HAD superfamily)